jgi:hypothetical protein
MIYIKDATLTWTRVMPSSDLDRIEVGDEYVDRFWLPVVGPSSINLLRWAQRERPVLFPAFDIGPVIGLGKATGKYSPINRTINRMILFGLISQSRVDDTTLIVRSIVRPLTKGQRGLLPESLRTAEIEWWNARIEALPKPTNNTREVTQ